MYPIALDLRDRLVVVVGGGAVAERKVRGLLAAGARVRVVASHAGAQLRAFAQRSEIELHERRYESADLDGARLTYAATDDDTINAQVVADARARGVLVDDTSGRAGSDFATPLAHHVGPLTFAVDTGGTSPSFARRLRDELRAVYDERYARAAQTLARARAYAKIVVPADQRGAVMERLAAGDIDELATLQGAAIEHEVELAYAALRSGGPINGTVKTERPLVAATRGSRLALWQARHVAAALARAGIISTLLPVTTLADKVPDRPLTALGADGVFVKELELALREGRADYAVHSCKDLPSSLPDDMVLAALGPRADPRDAFCSERYPSFDELPPGAVVGTSSPRRRALLQAKRPDLVFQTIRGNVETRLRKLRESHVDAIILARAGLERLNLRARYTVCLDPDVVVPAAGQGALAVETRAADDELAQRLHAAFSHKATELAIAAERAFLRTCRGGCQAPIGAYATSDAGMLSLRAVIAAPGGNGMVTDRITASAPELADCERAGVELATRLLAQGGAALLAACEPEHANGPLTGYRFLLARTLRRPSTIAPIFERLGATVAQAHDSAAAAMAFSGHPPDVVLFPSSASVASIASYLAGLRVTGVHPIVAGMGDATSAAAAAAGFAPDVTATVPTVEAFVHSVTRYVLERHLG